MNNIPKTIYFTYKKTPPQIVFDRWEKLNPDYQLYFSLDKDCIDFLQKHFGNSIVELFKNIKEGMYKADLWRLCKLYILGGIYADIDLIPYISINDIIKKSNNNTTFYSTLGWGSGQIFQAMIITTPKNPLLLSFLHSFILKKLYLKVQNGPTVDMFNCMKYNLFKADIIKTIKPFINYNLNEILIYINIGPSLTHTKIIDLYNFDNNYNYSFELEKNKHNYTFKF